MNESTLLSTPVEIDTEIARLMMEQARPARTIALQNEYRDSDSSYRRHFFDQDALDAAEAEHDRLQVEIDALTERYTGWPRYYHVTNNNGHIHTSTSCSSCFHDTQFAWRADLSGLTPEEVVEREAHNACTVCMPIAPVEQKAARQRYNAAQREAKAAERQAKKDAKAAKARERAVKLVDKVQVAIDKMGGLDAFRNDYSLYGHDGRKSLYAWTFDGCQQTVGDILYEIKDREENGDSRRSMNEHIKAELAARGLI